MTKYLKNNIKLILKKIKLFISVNWFKTLFFNFKKFPFKTAIQLPVFFYGPVSFKDISGKIIIKAPIKKGMIGFGQRFEMIKKHKGNAELRLSGTLVFNGHAHIGKDVFIHISKNAYCEFGFMGCLASDVKLICTNRIVIGSWAGIGFESQLIDSNFHPYKDLKTKKDLPISKPIYIGNNNSFSNRVSIMAGTITPNNCVVASNSVCNKDYTNYGEYILLGGIPAKLLKDNFARDWDIEKSSLLKSKILWQNYNDLL
ncbi:acyltransferase [Aurantibacter sp.]|uniref:acyltransferase n=1 Tax=Aurantibacter sp. TaxID=2807103 RepID=UPI0035C86E44